MLTIIPDLHTNNEFYQENTLLSLSARLQEENFDNQLLLLNDDADAYIASLARVKTPVIYLFDEIRAINTAGASLTIADLNIPDKYNLKVVVYVESTCVDVFDGDQHVMQVILGTKGELQTVDYFEDNGHIRDRYDTRGFRSSRSVFNQQGQLTQKLWFNATSDLVMMQHEDLTVTIPPRQQFRFQKANYSNLAEVEYEFVLPHLAGAQRILVEPSEDSFALRRFLLQTQVCYYFTNEFQITSNDFSNLVQRDMYLFQSKTLAEIFAWRIKQCGVKFVPLQQVIPPYFSDFALGTSMELETQLVYWHVGSISDDELKNCFYQLLDLLKEHEDIKVIADANDQQIAVFKEISSKFITEFKEKVGELDDEAALADLDDDELDVDQIAALNRFSCPNNLKYEQELQLINQAHVYVDTDLLTNFDLQLEAVKTGIPQIVRQSNDLVKEGKNGFLLKPDLAIKAPIDWFLVNLDKWNVAVVENVRLIQKMSLRTVLVQWKKVLKNG
ncbi:accessory Sec system glycosyltransferase Asp1 [Lactobacillus sp. ESL0679]|uniref:accessory Sec system glycosyltransferase Asp1 n=1 Tax=Lactobacillus sp. ESL0679 TaxID=2983209 RepID=UPI0023F7C265|nr:accessory Sec system glycosyltransferase Asp1 [Lactobacillus sp. ESL0679]MDF7683422.1 accessory Sec system glycosyltransferase Asp1 [Lactobacillus sp. ESL0679]